MGVNLTKGQKISLSKEGGGDLSRIAVGLGWGKRTIHSKGFFGIGAGVKQEDVDLDASCIMYDVNKQPVDSVWFRKLKSQDGSVVHTGDDLVGGGGEQEPNEIINVDLPRVPPQVQSIVFVVNSYSGHTFDGVPFAFCNIVDATKSQEIARYNLTTDGGAHIGFVIAKLYRRDNEWKFHAIGERSSGRTINEIQPHAADFA